MRQFLRSIVAIVVSFSVAFSVQAAVPSGDAQSLPTHKQLRTIKPKHAERDVTLWTFSLAKGGDLWLSVSTEPRYAQVHVLGKPAAANQEQFQGVQVYDPDGQLKAEHPLKFNATAINFAPDGSLFVAGQGRLAHLSAGGELLAEGPTPNIDDPEEFKKKVVEQAKVQRKQYAEQYRKQAQGYAKQVEQLEKKSETDRTEQEQAQLEALKQQKQQFEQIADNFGKQEVDPESTVLDSLTIPGIAATSEHVFVVVSSTSGRGYEVWRTNHQFADGKVVRSGLSGCCGNMDVQARDDGFVACENTQFKVVSYSRDGKQLSSFGKRDRSAPEGFGSCCNPMNCLSLAGGEFLVAESSIGNIKRFDAQGKFLAMIGKARISGSCKHVSLGFDDARNRYYMMNQDKNHICVLVPLAEAPVVTEEERLSQEARQGLGKKLVGHWRLENAKPKAEKKTAESALANLLRVRRGQADDIEAEFLENDSAKITGGMFANFAADSLSWECVEQSGSVLQISVFLDGVEFQTLRVKFTDDDHLQFENSPYFPQFKTFVRATDKPTEASAAEDAAK
jgi:hypothetical protein